MYNDISYMLGTYVMTLVSQVEQLEKLEMYLKGLKLHSNMAWDVPAPRVVHLRVLVSSLRELLFMVKIMVDVTSKD